MIDQDTTMLNAALNRDDIVSLDKTIFRVRIQYNTMLMEWQQMENIVNIPSRIYTYFKNLMR